MVTVRTVVPALVVAAALLLLLPASTVGAAGLTSVQWKDGLLSVVAEQAPIDQLLDVIARETRLEVSGLDGIEAMEISASFAGVSLGDGLRSILSELNYVLVEDSGPDGVARPIAVTILGRRGGPSREPLAKSGVKRSDGEDQKTGRVAAWLVDGDPTLRRWAVSRLGETRSDQNFAQLLAALQDGDAEVRQTALAGLVQYGGATVEPVKALLRAESVTEIRVTAFGLLGQVGGGAVAELLRAALQDSEVRVRMAAVEALGHADNAIGREALATAARDRDPGVRMTALRTLALYARDDAAKEVIGQAALDHDETVRGVAKGLLEVFTEVRGGEESP